MKELVRNGDFSNGNKGFDSDYTFVSGKAGSQPDVQPSYSVDKTPAHAANAWPDWDTFGDHTTGDGKMLLLNGGAGDAWRENIELDPGKQYVFSVFIREVDNGTSGFGTPPQIQFMADHQAIGTVFTVEGSNTAGWEQLTFTYSPTSTTHIVSIQDLNTDPSYNDFALDDISVLQTKSSTGSASVAGIGHLDAALGGEGAHPAFVTIHAPEHLAIA